MSHELILYALVFMFGTFISAVSQVLLKKSAMRKHDTRIAEYLNPLVVVAYSIFVLATLMTIVAYKVVPLSLGPILEATSYLYVTAFGVLIFKEEFTRRKAYALLLILVGIVVFSISV